MALFDFIARLLERDSSTPADRLPEHARPLLPKAVDLVVDTVEPRLRALPDYRARLEGGVVHSLLHIRSHILELPPPLLLSEKGWREDPHLNALFATAAGVGTTLGESEELRAFFGDSANIACDEAFALLSMQRRERTVLGTGLEGDMVRTEIPQQTVSFSEHRIVVPAADEQTMRLELCQRTFRHLIQIALERVRTAQERTHELTQFHARQQARLRWLQGRAHGLDSLAEDSRIHGDEIEALESELAGTTAELGKARIALGSMEDYFGVIDSVLSHPADHLQAEKVVLRLDRMNRRVDAAPSTAVNEITLTDIRIGEGLSRSVLPVRCRRADLPERVNRLAHGERYL